MIYAQSVRRGDMTTIGNEDGDSEDMSDDELEAIEGEGDLGTEGGMRVRRRSIASSLSARDVRRVNQQR